MITSSKGTFTVKDKDEIVAVDQEAFDALVANASVKKLLKRSIEKWQFIVDLQNLGLRITRDGGRTTCALCSRFEPWGSNHCEGCPVYEDTGSRGCAGTGYQTFSEELSLEAEVEGAIQELGFLQRLLREKEVEETELKYVETPEVI